MTSSHRPSRRHGSRSPFKPQAVGSLSGSFSLAKIGARRFDPRDPYHFAVSLSWPAFILGFLGCWLSINLIFAVLYVLDPHGIVNARPGAFGDAFFFSIETLATVGYGVMAPESTYAHVVSAVEILGGTSFSAIVTGLLFVRFSRPKPRFRFADNAVITRHNGHPTLMIRLVNERLTPMTGANARLFALVGETTDEGYFFRRIHDLPLEQSHLPLFVMPWTVMHRIGPGSPFFGLDATTLPSSDVRLFVTVEARDRALASEVQDIKDYHPSQICLGMRYADAITVSDDGNATADLSRLSLLEPDGTVPASGQMELS
ncbi:MAG TPA: ion channel [Rhodopila sp.]|uniref:ion channel n=1 Tax=Rhodopila sp. TaxID=2480087 RepID=UPI002CCB844B|nr:ion channel [Rhodopila sp.]HVY17868.1 ion channel [Rhodopila sp.]